MRIPDFVKKWWDRAKYWWECLPKLPRKWRIVRNLAVAALAAALIPPLLEWPCLDAYRAFQRIEGAYLLTPSRLVLQEKDGWCTGYLSEGDSWIAVGSVSGLNSTDRPLNLDRNYAMLHQVLPKEGIVAVLLPAKNENNGAVVAVWGSPEEAAYGTMELDLAGIKGRHEDMLGREPIQALETFTAQARRREDGWFIFQFTPHDDHRESQGCAMEELLWYGPVFSSDEMEQSYRLTLTDARGEPVAEQTGTLPPDQRMQKW